MSGYRVVDLRGQIAPARSDWGNSGKGAGVILHYNGDPAPARAWNKPIQWIRFINDLHKQPGRFAPGWQINGIAYCEWIIGNTVYRLRDWQADLPHCGNLYWNRNALGLHIPIGGNQRPQDAGKGTMITALQRADDHLRAMGKPRSALKGHREVGASACPGSPIMASIANYRAGAQINVDAPKPAAPAPPAQSKTIYRVQAGWFEEYRYADRREKKLQQAGFKAFKAEKDGGWAVYSGAFGEIENARRRARALERHGFGAFPDPKKA